MTEQKTIAQIFDYDSKKQTLNDIIRNFEKYHKLTKELYEPFIEKEKLIDREAHFKAIHEDLDFLVKTYENLINAGFKFDDGDEDYKNHILEVHILSLLNKELRYSGIKDLIKSEYNYLFKADFGVSCEGLQSLPPPPPEKKIPKIEPKIKLEDLDYYHSLVKESKELRKVLYTQASSLRNLNWKEFIETWMNHVPNSDRAFKNIKGGKYSVIKFIEELEPLEKPFVIKFGEKDLNSLTFEKDLIDYINDKLMVKKNFGGDTIDVIPYHQSKSIHLPRVYLPQIIYFSKHPSGEEYLVLEREKENAKLTDDTLTPNQKKDCLNAILEFLSFIHTYIPLEASQKGKIDIHSLIKSKLENKLLCLTKDIKTKCYNNLKPILDCFPQESYVFHKDSILDNFVIYKREGFTKEICDITSLDWEDHGFQPLYFDLVNLLEYSDYLSLNEKEEFLKSYTQFYNLQSWKRKSKKLEYNSEFKLYYLNAVIYRSICLTSAWSNPRREDFRPRRGYILNRAVECIKIIKDEHNDYYNKYRTNYDSLEEALKETIATLS